MRRAAIFDLFFTIVWEDFSGPFYASLAEDLGLDINVFRDSYWSLSTTSMQGRITSLADRIFRAAVLCGAEVTFGQVMEVANRRQCLYYGAIHLYEDAEQALAGLKQIGVSLGLASNASSYSAKAITESGVAHYFDAMLMSWEVGILKPNPGIYREICRRMGILPSEAVFIGDGGDQELRGAKEVGMTTILVDRGLSHTAAARAYADYQVGSLSEAASIIKSAARQPLRPGPRREVL